MTRRSIVGLTLLACGFAACGLPGCAVASDLLNPDLLAGLGLDPNSITPSSGWIVVVFTNNTDQRVEFNAYAGIDATDLAAGVSLPTAEIPPGERSNEPIKCPIAVLSPGEVDEDFTPVLAEAAIVGIGSGTETAVAYQGGPLFAGFDFFCGDVIEIELNATAPVGGDPQGNNQAQYSFRIRRLPGR